MTSRGARGRRLLTWLVAMLLAVPFWAAAPQSVAQNGAVRSEPVPDEDEARNAWPDDPPAKPAKPAKPANRAPNFIQPGPDGIVRTDPVVEPGDPGYTGPAPKPRPRPQPPIAQPESPKPQPPQPQAPDPEPPRPEPAKPQPPKPQPPKPQPVPEPAPQTPAPQPQPAPKPQPPKFKPPRPVLVPEPGGDAPPPPVTQPQPSAPQPPRPQPQPQPPRPGEEFIPPEAFPEPVGPSPQPQPQPQPEPPAPRPPAQPEQPQPEPQPQASAGLVDSGLSDVTGRRFTYFAPGDLKPGTGTGVRSATIFAPGMRYPIETAPSFPNSQVYGRGGYLGPGGGLCDAANYAYPWRDNFCEKRGWQTPACPGGRGHQGQDIRAMDCKNAVHWVVAVEEGVITKIGGWSVILKGTSGREYIYLHMRMRDLAVRQGQLVKRGQRIGKVSNDFGGQPTSIHLHFEIRANVALPGQPAGFRKVPPYSSLVDSYKRLLRGEP